MNGVAIPAAFSAAAEFGLAGDDDANTNPTTPLSSIEGGRRSAGTWWQHPSFASLVVFGGAAALIVVAHPHARIGGSGSAGPASASASAEGSL